MGHYWRRGFAHFTQRSEKQSLKSKMGFSEYSRMRSLHAEEREFYYKLNLVTGDGVLGAPADEFVLRRKEGILS